VGTSVRNRPADVVYRHFMANQFFRAKRFPAIVFGVLFVLFGLFLSVSMPTWLSVGRGNPAGTTVKALTKDKAFRDEAARFFIEKLTEDGSSEDLARYDELRTTISDKLDELAANDEFMAKVDAISGDIYDFFVQQPDETRVVDAKAVVSQVVDALAQVDPQFAGLSKDVDDWEGLKLEPIKDGPDVKAIKDGLTNVFWASLILTVLCGVLYARWSRSKKGALLFLGVTVLVLGIIDVIAASGIRSAANSAVDNEDKLAAAAVPVAADSLLKPFRMIGVVWIVLGVGAIIAGVVVARRGRNVVESSEPPSSKNVTSGAADAND